MSEKAVGLIKKYAEGLACRSKEDVVELQRLAVAIVGHLQWKMQDLISAGQGEAVLQHFSSDCTPISHKVRISVKSGPSTTQRSGRATQEYLVQQCFTRRIDGKGQVFTSVLLSDPLPLTAGKSAQH
eukprot:4809964-Lingulodinium_polyedra.AAC.1